MKFVDEPQRKIKPQRIKNTNYGWQGSGSQLKFRELRL